MTRRSCRARWPRETPAELRAFYGWHELGADGLPTAAWEARSLVTVVIPYPMVAAWDPTLHITRVRCHRRVATSLLRILHGILQACGSLEAVRDARMHLLGGTYSYRRISGSSRISLHAWGAAIDLDPRQNPLGRPWSADRGMVPRWVVDLFEAEGWTWGGRFTRPDCMHFQATSRSPRSAPRFAPEWLERVAIGNLLGPQGEPVAALGRWPAIVSPAVPSLARPSHEFRLRW